MFVTQQEIKCVSAFGCLRIVGAGIASVENNLTPTWPGYDSRLCSADLTLSSTVFLPPQKPTLSTFLSLSAKKGGSESHFVDFSPATEIPLKP